MRGRTLLFAAIAIVIIVGLFFFTRAVKEPADQPAPPGPGDFALTSTAFEPGQAIPANYTADGANVSPPLAWTNAPKGTVTFALVMEDPDAPVGVYLHWMICEIPAAATGLPEAVRPTGNVEAPVSVVQGVNGARKVGYTGPNPPKGKPHHYLFKLYALDEKLYMNPEFTRLQLEDAMRVNILGTATLVGLYQRK